MSFKQFVIPEKSKAGVLDPEIAGEGQKVILSDGDVVEWLPPPIEPVIPDLSKVKSLAKYFRRQGFVPWPAWFYHKDGAEPARLLKNAEVAMEIGVCYRECSPDERMRYGRNAMYDWQDDSPWRPNPSAKDLAFDPSKSHTGKTVVYPERSTVAMQNDLVAALIPQVAAAVAAAMKTKEPTATGGIDPERWARFREFEAWEEASQIVPAVVENALASASAEDAFDDPPTAAQTNERDMWLREAEERGIHVDRRWSTERLKAAVAEAA